MLPKLSAMDSSWAKARMEVEVPFFGGLPLSKGEEAEFVLDRLRHMRGNLEGAVDPIPEIPARKQVPSQESDQIRQRPAKAGAKLGVLDEQHGDQDWQDLDRTNGTICRAICATLVSPLAHLLPELGLVSL